MPARKNADQKLIEDLYNFALINVIIKVIGADSIPLRLIVMINANI
jgi:hypothetical protein